MSNEPSRDRVSSHNGFIPRTPRWVLVTGAVLLVIVIVVLVMLVAAGDHGPGRHM